MQKKVLKRYPSTCRSDSDEVLTFLSDDDIDTAVYNLFQFYSKPVEVEDENGNKIIETRVYKKDLPNNQTNLFLFKYFLFIIISTCYQFFIIG